MIRSTNQKLGEYDLIKEHDHVAQVWRVVEAALPSYWELFMRQERVRETENERSVLARVFDDALTSYEKDAQNTAAFSHLKPSKNTATTQAHSNRRSRATCRS